jgi:predicted ester cyclase/ketosteroid isomerase-like protein
MSIEQNKTLVKDFLEGTWNYEKLVSLDDLLAPTYRRHCPCGEISGRREFRDAVASELESLATMYVRVDDLVAEGDRVSARHTTWFDHHGELMGAFPTGRTITMQGMSLHRIEDGRVAESWETYDRRCLMRNLAFGQNLSDPDRIAIERVIANAVRLGLRDKRAHVEAYYAESAEVVAAHGESVRGRAHILAWLERFPPISEWNLSDVEIDGAGEVAYVRGSYTMHLSSRARLPFDKGRYLEVWRKQSDESWKVIRRVFSSEVASRTRQRAATPVLASV